jgi:hypothetical protein
VSVGTSIPRPAQAAGKIEIGVSARRRIGTLIERLRQAGSDPARIFRTRMDVRSGAYCTTLARLRDEMLDSRRAINSIFFLREDSEDDFVTEIDAAERYN